MSDMNLLKSALEFVAILALTYLVVHEADVICFEHKIARFLRRVKRAWCETVQEKKARKRAATVVVMPSRVKTAGASVRSTKRTGAAS